jgi:hypothetical protein
VEALALLFGEKCIRLLRPAKLIIDGSRSSLPRASFDLIFQLTATATLLFPSADLLSTAEFLLLERTRRG